MPVTKVIKQPSDLIFNTVVAQATAGNEVAAVTLLQPGDAESVVLVHSADEMPDMGFDENTDVYDVVAAMYEVKDFEGPVAIGTYSSSPVVSLDDLTVIPTADGATIGAQVSGVQKYLEDHLLDGSTWFVPVGMSDDDIKTAADILYTNQRGFLVNQVDNIADLQKWHDYATTTQVEKNKLGHFRTLVDKDNTRKIAGQAAAYASTKVLLDWMRIGDLSQFVANDWTQSELNMIDNLHGLAVVNKSGNMMLSGNKELNGDQIDNSFNAQYNTDLIQTRLQKWLNGKDYTTFNDDNINELVTTAETAGEDLFKEGTIAADINGKADFSVTAVSRSQVSAYEITQRTYKSLSIKQTLPNAIEKVYVSNSISL
ncbi:hypothetical protein [Levilactobacillus lindianensis]|uniref:hypothetical protein n=1 Tax=Levilactobacillus lindianensis TaxID=2486018 RepID=UPI000F74B635|nr:hypothetical protein [Levilactobacillus lindianensis]